MSATSPEPPTEPTASTRAAPPPGAPPPPPPPPQPNLATADDTPAPEGTIDRLRLIGGLIALGIGLLALIIVVVVALAVKPDTTGGSIATAAIGVIGSIVGAYFGVKVGSDGTQKAIQAQQDEATKAQVFALHASPDDAAKVMGDIHTLLTQQHQQRR